jgi:preprotein translocase subunit SecF
MEFFKKETHINFMGYRRYTVVALTLLSLAALIILFSKGLNLGLDFTGGTQIDARFETPIDPSVIRSKLEHAGLRGVKVQQYGSTQDFLIRVANPKTVSDQDEIHDETLKADEQELKNSKNLKALLQKDFSNIEIRRTEFVGSEVGEQLFEQGVIAVLMAIFATMIYIALRFEYRLAVSAAVGLIHDAILLLGVFALCGFEFDLATLASVLAVLGYSLNDTIVVFDRVRENFRKVRKGTPAEIMNLSINQTLSRTIMTSLLTLLVVLALLFFGGESLFGFSMAFFLGILIGTVSSIYVSGALALWMGLTRADLMPKPKAEYEEGS